MANRDLAHRLLQCLTMAIRPLRLEELAEIVALDFDGAEGATPQLNEGWQSEDRQRDVLSTCSSLITLVGSGRSRVIQFSHFSVKEFLTSNRLSTSQGDISRFHIREEPAHVTLAQACLGTLLHLDVSSNLKGYASRHWVEHAQFKTVSSRIEVGMRRLFNLAKPYFAAWLQLHDIDDRWAEFGNSTALDRGSPLYYASLCGFRDLAAHIIVEHPEQVNARGGHNYSPLAAALYKRHFDVAELLHQHGATLDVTGYRNRTLLHAASVDGLIDLARWLLDHGVVVDSQDDDLCTPINLAAVDGHLEIVRRLLGYSASINAANDVGNTPLHGAANNGHVEIVRLLLQRGADLNAQDKVYLMVENSEGRTPLHLASSSGEAEIVQLLLDRGANVNAVDRDGWTPLYLAWTNEVARLLLDHGARVDVNDKAGTPLFPLALRMGKFKIVQTMMEYGAQVDREL